MTILTKNKCAKVLYSHLSLACQSWLQNPKMTKTRTPSFETTIEVL